MRIFVGNLPWEATEEDLKKFFEPMGEVAEAVIITRNGRSRGFGFVEMPNEEEAKKAIKELNEKELGGRKVVVNEARPRKEE
ncbi:RNA-binding protein [bacterium]|nr:RNA-binding protein [bacterium]